MPLRPSKLDYWIGRRTSDKIVNPFHIAIAARGYQIQSHVFQIPDRFGYFSPGSPRLQAHQGSLFVAWSALIGTMFFLAATMVYFTYLNDKHYLVAGAMCSVAVVGLVAMSWHMACRDPRRNPDYDWEEEKLQRE